MPYSINKDDGGYTVRSPKGVKARRTSKSKAERQVRLLQAIKHGFEPDKQRHHSCANGTFLDKRIDKFHVMRN